MSSLGYTEILERAYKKIRAQKSQIEELEAEVRARIDPIAIVGFACRFPGDAVDGESFWRVLNSGHDVFAQIGDDRWPIARHHDVQGRTAGKTYTLAAGLVRSIDCFDAPFFGIPSIEAEALDPQQRLLLEVSWHAFEDALIDPRSLRKSRTGVFVGLTTDDYARLHARSPLPVSTYTGLGSAKSMAAGRLAYFYDLRGPAVQLDTTCSSSLVALHLAMRELREGTCDRALVAGANAIVSPDTTIGFCEMKALSPTGKLRAFDDRADGYVRGEGCGALVLKRLSDALRDGDRVHAIVRGTAMNHDGRTNGLTAPNPEAQEEVVRSALRAAGCTPDDIQYIETHGTGTRLGDLIEATALGSVFRERATPVRLGSVKANIGHLEAAAGTASIIKVILALKHGFVPGQVNLSTPNQKVDWTGFRLDVSASSWTWTAGDRVRRAGVSAFGMSGTNVHVILEEAPRAEPSKVTRSLPVPPLLLISAKSGAAMAAHLRTYADVRAGITSQQHAELACASQCGRTHFDEFRCAIRLDGADPIPAAESVENARVLKAERDGVVFVFGGHETVHPGMAAELYRDSQTFRTAFDRCAAVFRDHTGGDLVSLACAPEQGPVLLRPEHAIPALVAMQLSLLQLWGEFGLSPGAAVGHGAGDYAAAVAAGSLGEEEAMMRACEGSPQALDEEVSFSRARHALTRLLEQGFRRFLEIGPDSTLAQAIRDAAETTPVAVAATLRRGGNAWHDLGSGLAALYEMGVDLSWASLWRPAARIIELPLYHFERRRHWLRVPTAVSSASGGSALGFATSEQSRDGHHARLRVVVGSAHQPHLSQHKLFGVTVLAGASWIALWLAVGRAALGTPGIAIERLQFLRPLVLEENDERELEIVLDALPGGGFRFAATGTEASQVAPYCEGELRELARSPANAEVARWQREAERLPLDMQAFYEAFVARGYTLGPAFRWLVQGEDGARSAWRRLSAPELPADRGCYPVFPGAIDSCFHALAGLLGRDAVLAHGQEIVIPTSIESIRFYGAGAEPGEQYDVFASSVGADGEPLPPLSGGLTLLDASGNTVMELANVRFRRVSRLMLERSLGAAVRTSKYTSSWRAVEASSASSTDTPRVLALGPAAAANAREVLPAGAPVIEVPVDAGAEGIFKALALGAPGSSGLVIAVATPPAFTLDDVDLSERAAVDACWLWLETFRAFVRSAKSTGAALRVVLPGALCGRVDGGALVSSTVAGMLRSAAAEYPQLSLIVADCADTTGEAELIRQLYAGALSGAPAGEYSWTGEAWHERFLLPAPELPRGATDLAQGVAIVTGGTGGLAPHFAAWLLESGAAKVLLVGRSCEDGAAHPDFDGRVEFRRCDVGDEHAVQRLFASIATTGERVTAIVHAAGALADRPIAGLLREDLEAALAPKLRGCMTLARAWKSEDLKLFLAVSSLSTVTGSPAQAAYTAANRFLDRWVDRLREQNVPAFSLQLGPVSAGMASRLEKPHQDRLKRLGLNLLPPSGVGEGASYVLSSPTGALAFYAPSEVAPVRDEQSQAAPLDETPVSADAVFDALSEKAAELIGNVEVAALKDASLVELGADSLLAVELSTWIQDSYGLDYSMEAVLAKPTLRAIAIEIAEECTARVGKNAGAAKAGAASIWTEGQL